MSDSDSNSNDDETFGSLDFESQVGLLEQTVVVGDDFTLLDVLQKFKDQVRLIAETINQLDQHLDLVKNPVNPATHLEMLKVKKNIINGITHLLKETIPLNYPAFRCLNSVKLLKTYEKVSSESKLLLNNLNQDNGNTIKLTDGLKQLTIFLNEFQQEFNKVIAKNIRSDEVEQEISREFKECKSDMYSLLSLVDSSLALKEILSLLVECEEDDDEDTWVNIENMPHLFAPCQKLKKNGFVLQNQQNKYLFKLNN